MSLRPREHDRRRDRFTRLAAGLRIQHEGSSAARAGQSTTSVTEVSPRRALE